MATWIILISGLISLSVWLYIFNIYEIKFKVDFKKNTTHNNIEIKVDVIPLNSFGFRVPFRNPKIDYHVKKTEDFIDIRIIDNRKNIFIVDVLNGSDIILEARSRRLMFPAILNSTDAYSLR